MKSVLSDKNWPKAKTIAYIMKYFRKLNTTLADFSQIIDHPAGSEKDCQDIGAFVALHNHLTATFSTFTQNY